jgi:hypothetical protein
MAILQHEIEVRAVYTPQGPGRGRASRRHGGMSWLRKDATVRSATDSILNRELVNLPEDGEQGTNGERGGSRVQPSVTEDGMLEILGSPSTASCAEAEENKPRRADERVT